MGSEQNDGTSFPLAEPLLCANGCGFFGTAANMNLCSKCYRDLRVKEDQAASAKAAVEKSLCMPKIKQQEAETQGLNVELKNAVVGLETVPDDVGSSSSGTPILESVKEVKPPNRCFNCNKKVGLTGFKCKCGGTFCGAHRYAEKHDCEFDFKGVARDAIAKANPLVKADKVDRF